MIEDTFSNSIQMTEARACLAENIAAELDLLMQLYVEPLRVAAGPPADRPRGDRRRHAHRSSNAPACGR